MKTRRREAVAITLAAAISLGIVGCGKGTGSGGEGSGKAAKGAEAKREGTVEERVSAIVNEQLGLDSPLAPTDDIMKKGEADSLDVVEIVMAVEEEFGFEIADAEAEKMRTIADIAAYIEKAQAKKGSP